MRSKIAVCGIAAGLLAGGVAQAQESSPWMVRARAVQLNFDNGQSSGLPLAGDTTVMAKNRWIPEVDISYFFTRNIAAELVLTTPQNVRINVAGNRAGSVKALPPSLVLQYHFTDFGKFKPYVGAGVNYTRFFNRNHVLDGAAEVDKSSVGLVAQVGFDYMINKNWGVNVDVKYIRMDTDVRLGGQKIGRVDLNPITAGVGVTYRF